MKFWQARLDGSQEFNIVVSVEVFGEPALDAHLGGAMLNRLNRLGQQRIGGMKIGIW